MSHRKEPGDVEHDRDLEQVGAELGIEQRLRIVGVDEAERRQHDERQEGNDQCAHPRLRGERAQLMLGALAAAHAIGNMLEDVGEAAAHVGLNLHCGDQKTELLERHAAQHPFQRLRDCHAELHLLDHRPKLLPNRVGHVLRRHLKRAQQCMAGLERGFQKFDQIRELLANQLEPSSMLSILVQGRNKSERQRTERCDGGAKPSAQQQDAGDEKQRNQHHGW